MTDFEHALYTENLPKEEFNKKVVGAEEKSTKE